MAFTWVEIIQMDTLSFLLSSQTVVCGFDSSNVLFIFKDKVTTTKSGKPAPHYGFCYS